MSDRNDFQFDDVFSDIFESVYGDGTESGAEQRTAAPAQESSDASAEMSADAPATERSDVPSDRARLEAYRRQRAASAAKDRRVRPSGTQSDPARLTQPAARSKGQSAARPEGQPAARSDGQSASRPEERFAARPGRQPAAFAETQASAPQNSQRAEPSGRKRPEPEESFDPRFRVDRRADGERRRDYSYAGKRVSSSQEYGYEPGTGPDYEELRSSYGENEEYELDKQLGLAPEEAPQKKSVFGSVLGKIIPGKDKNAVSAEEINRKYGASDDGSDDNRTAASDPSELKNLGSGEDGTGENGKNVRNIFKKRPKALKKKDEASEEFDEDYSGAYGKEDEVIPRSSFKDYLTSRLATVLLKLRGGVPTDAMTGSANAEGEFLGEEMDPLSASKYYGGHVFSLRKRARIALLLTALSVYLSLGGPAPGMLSNLKVATAACLAIELTVMLLAVDVVTNAVLNCFRGKVGADTLAVFSAIIAAIDALTVLNTAGVTQHMPFCSLASVTMTGMLFSSLLSARSLRKALRVPAIAKKKYSVTTEMNITGREITALKSSRPITGFLRRIEEAPVDEIVYSKAAIVIAAASLFFSIVAVLVKKSFSRILYVYSASLCAAVPFTALLCFALPFFMGSIQIFGNGGALAGWSGIYDLGHSRNLIVTDTDVFPEECISIENVRIFADYDSEKVITYAGSLIRASGCGLAPVFESLMEENDCSPVEIDNLEYLSGGGIKGMAEGNIIIVGGTDLMRLMNIRVPYRLVSQTSVLLSINGILYGIFNINYKADPRVRKALVSLMRSSRHPVFAIRDFNVTPEMLREHFDVATDGYDFPPYSDRFRISEAKPSGNSQISAVVCREGLGPLTDVADTARKIYVVSIINVCISLASSLIGILYVFISILSSGVVSVGSLVVFTLIFNIPVLILGVMTTRFE